MSPAQRNLSETRERSELAATRDWHPRFVVFLIISCQLVFSYADRLLGADCNSNGIVDECDISCGETGGPCDLPGCGLSSDCNVDGIPDDCEVSGEVCSFPVLLAGNMTGATDAIFTGPPDDVFYGLGGQVVTYRLGCLLIDGPGPDFTVYEVDSGAAEFSSIDVLVSQDGVQFISVKSSEQGAVNIPGDEIHGSNTFARSYDLTAAGLFLARFIRIDGNGTGAAGASTGFDLDAIGVVNGVSDCNTNGVPDDCDADPADPDGNGQTSNDCNANSIPDECEPDCNGNGVPDDCDLDIADPDGNGQTSNDCDSNAVPDECDPDCDDDGEVDACEIAAGTANDCNRNNVPDNCDMDPSDPDGNGQVSGDCNSDAVPDECPACPPVEIVFAMDTSTSMNDEGAALCTSINQVLIQLASLGINTSSLKLGIADAPGGVYSCLTDSVINAFGTTVPGTPPPGNEVLGACPGGDQVAQEDWGRAVSVIAGHKAWGPGAIRLIIPLSDEGPWCGDPVTNPGVDRDSIIHAISVANAYNTIVSPITGSGSSSAVINMARMLADGTGGVHFASSDAPTDIASGIEAIVVTACKAFVDCNANNIPDECDLDPDDPDRNGLVSPDCNSNIKPDECEADCNTNGVPDDCDIDPSDPDGNEQVSPDCNSNAKPDECEYDCNVNGIPDDCDVDLADPDGDGLISPNCNGNTLPDECESGEAPLACRFPTTLAENTTGAADSYFTGPPDTVYLGLGGQIVTYSFDCLVFDGPDADITVYEVDSGSAEFGLMDVLVSMDGLSFISVKQTEGSAIRIPGDESYTNMSFARSYDLAITGWPWIRFLRIDGNGTGAAGGYTGFDLDAVGAIHIPFDCDVNGIPDACDPDTDVDGVVDGCDLCPGTVSGLSVDSNGCPPLIACDDDRDGDVDTADMAAFESRASGPGVFCIGDCTGVDFDADFDIDQADFAVCQTCFSGAGVPAAASCRR